MGDALLVVPALRALKTAYPAAQLDVLTTATGRVGLEGLPYLDRLLVFDKYQFDSPRAALAPGKLGQAAAFLGGLRLRRYDAVIFFHHMSLRWGTLKYRGLAAATGARWRVGLDNRTPAAHFLNVSVPDRGFGADGLTERDYWRQLVEALLSRQPGASFEYDPRPQIAISLSERERATELLHEVKAGQTQRPIIALGPGSGTYTLTRRWPAIYYARLADRLAQHYGAKIALLGSSAEMALTEQIRALSEQPDAIENLAGRTSAKELAAFLEGCRLFVGNDGGLAQLAGVAGLPSVVIFGPTNHIAWSPFGTEEGRVRLVQAEMDLPCRPCLYRGRTLGSRLGCAARPCLTTISPEQVFETIQALLLSD